MHLKSEEASRLEMSVTAKWRAKGASTLVGRPL